jgi:hypothetical protein
MNALAEPKLSLQADIFFFFFFFFLFFFSFLLQSSRSLLIGVEKNAKLGYVVGDGSAPTHRFRPLPLVYRFDVRRTFFRKTKVSLRACDCIQGMLTRALKPCSLLYGRSMVLNRFCFFFFFFFSFFFFFFLFFFFMNAKLGDFLFALGSGRPPPRKRPGQLWIYLMS